MRRISPRRAVRRLVIGVQFALVMLCCLAPALAQVKLDVFPSTDYAPLSFGRQLSLGFEWGACCLGEISGALLSQSTLVVSLPPGMRIVSAKVPYSFSGTPQTGQLVKLSVGDTAFGISDVLTVSVDTSVADGTSLQATLDLSGTPVITVPFNAVRDSTGTTVTITTGPYPFAIGGLVTISAASDPSFNGSFTIASIPSSGSLTYAQTGTPNAAAHGLMALALGAIDSGPVSSSFAVGYLPVSVSVVGSHNLCQAQATLGTPETTSFTNGLQATGSSESSLIGLFGLAARAGAATSALPTPPATVGDVVPGSGLTLLVGTQGNVNGGYTLAPDLSAARDLAGSIGPNTIGIFEGFNQPGCEIDFPTLQFSNPNPYDVAAILDVTFDGFASASDGEVVDPISGVIFGFPGIATTSGSLEADAGAAVESSRVSQEVRYAPNGNTLRTTTESSCWSDAPNCTGQPLTDTTVSFGLPNCSLGSCGFLSQGPAEDGFSGGLSIPRGNSQFGPGFDGFDPGVFLPNFLNIDLEAFSNIATFASGGGVSLIRSGWATGSASLTIRIARADGTLSGTAATLQISGHSPVSLLVTDAQGRRVGLLPTAPAPQLPGNPPPTTEQSPMIISEIFGASYTGPDTEPQTIRIPNPQAGDYNVQVTGTGSGPFTVDIRTLNISGTVLSAQQSTGTASGGSSNTIPLTLQQDGTIALKSACAVDATSSLAITRGGFRYNFGSGRFVQGITITNSGTSSIAGPVSLVLDNLSSNASLYSPTGTTGCAAPQGSPYITISTGDLAPGASASATLQFTDPTKAAITYNTRVLSGAGNR